MSVRLIPYASACALLLIAMLESCSSSNNASPGSADGGASDGAVAGGPACSILAIMNAGCTSCHGDPPTNAAPMSLTSLAALRAPSATYPGQTVAQRSVVRMTAGTMPPAPAGHSSAADITTLQAWVAESMPDCDSDGGASAGETSPNQIPQDELFACNGNTPGSSPGRLHRVDLREWELSFGDEVSALGWAQNNPFYPNPADQYTTYTSIKTVDDPTIGLYFDPSLAGSQLGVEVVGELRKASTTDTKLACIFSEAHPDAGCLSGFVPEFLQRHVLFRPPTAAETTHLTAFANTVLAGETALTDRPQSVGRIATAAWLTSGALFRSEVGGAPDSTGRARLTDSELAQALAYAIGDCGPRTPPEKWWSGADTGEAYTAPFADGSLADIAQAAEQGTIGNPATLDALFRAHAGGADLDRNDLAPVPAYVAQRQVRGQWWLADKLRGFFQQWLGYDAFPTVFKQEPGRTSQWDADGSIYSATSGSYVQLQKPYFRHVNMEPSMIEQFDDLIARVVVADKDVLKNLLTTPLAYVDATWPDFASIQGTQRPYGITTNVPDTRDGRWITLPATERSGVLTHPGWLASHGGNVDDDPSLIHRGHWIRENLLCQYIPPLTEVRVPAMVGPSAPDQTARSRVDAATAAPQCWTCHQLMNTLGEPFEIYNHAGFLRKFDHDGSAPNGTSTLVNMPDPALNGPVTSAIDFTKKLANSNWVKRCFIRQTFRYVVGRDETRADACSLAKMEKAYDVSGSVMSLWSAAIQSDAFLYRSAGGN